MWKRETQATGFVEGVADRGSFFLGSCFCVGTGDIWSSLRPEWSVDSEVEGLIAWKSYKWF